MFTINGHGQPSSPRRHHHDITSSPTSQQHHQHHHHQQQHQHHPPRNNEPYPYQQRHHQEQSRQHTIEHMMRAGGVPDGSGRSPTSASRAQPMPGADFGYPWLAQPNAGGHRPMGSIGGGMGVPGSSSHLPPQLGVSPQTQQQQQQQQPVDGPASAKKKKRRPEGESPTVEEKRTKTGRACDACRSKKIRCDILPADANTGEGQPICAHCKQYNIECTFFLPITETRFKKRRAPQDEASTAATPAAGKTESTNNGAPKTDSKPSAPTSIPFLLHNPIPTRQFEQYDMANHSHWEVSEGPDGQIVVEASLDAGDSEHATRLDKYVLPGTIMSALVNKYFEYDNMYLPVISRHEFLANPKPNPLLLYAICASASVSRNYPRHVFNRLRGLVNGLIRSNEIMSHAKLEHIQALLIIAPTGEIHAQPTAPTASAATMRTAVAIRMAQDLMFHREPKTQPTNVTEMMAVETRRRVWASLVFMDRWYLNSLGHPLMIDIHDCDVLLPSPRQIIPDLQPSEWPVNEGYLALIENLKLALISGRIVKLMYGPTELTHVTDEQLSDVLKELAAWRSGIPEPLQFTGTESSYLAGFLHICFTAINFLFWRGFIRVTRPPPPHLKTALDANRWAEMVQWSRAAIEWLNVHDRTLDTIFIFPYAATSCALIQYHTWARRRDPSALETLKLIRDVVQRWESAVQPDQMSIRRKSCETMTLLYEAALKTNPENDDRTDRSDGTPGSAAGSAPSVSKPSASTPASTTAAHDPANPPPLAFPSSRRALPPDLVNSEGEGPTLVEYDHSPALRAPVFEDTTEFDVSFLDSIPDSNFDWSGWGQYFETVDRMFPSGQAQTDADTDMEK